VSLCGILVLNISDINYLLPRYRCFDLSQPEIGELIGIPNTGSHADTVTLQHRNPFWADVYYNY
jgi:hypothetical protein